MSALYPSPASAIIARPRFRYEATRREDERKRKKTHPDQRFRVTKWSEIVCTVVLLIIVCIAARILSRSIAFASCCSIVCFTEGRKGIEITDRCIVRTTCPNVRDFIGATNRRCFPARHAARYEKLRQDTRGVAFNCRFVNREERCVRRNDRTKCLANTMLKGNGRNRRA